MFTFQRHVSLSALRIVFQKKILSIINCKEIYLSSCVSGNAGIVISILSCSSSSKEVSIHSEALVRLNGIVTKRPCSIQPLSSLSAEWWVWSQGGFEIFDSGTCRKPRQRLRQTIWGKLTSSLWPYKIEIHNCVHIKDGRLDGDSALVAKQELKLEAIFH